MTPQEYEALSEKEKAYYHLGLRRKANRGIIRVNNATLPYGSKKYAYCCRCGEEIVLPACNPADKPVRCKACKELAKFSILE